MKTEVAAVKEEEPASHSEQLLQDFKRWEELFEMRRLLTAPGNDEDLLQLPEEHRIECRPKTIEFKVTSTSLSI